MISAQLSLFDTATVIQPIYKIGDRVKLKRKTPHAACLKKEDVVQIEAIHPHNGSCKFWNELTESWGYLYPDEFVLLPSDKIDSVTPVEVAVTESTAPPAEIDSVTPVEVAVTESTAPPAEIDSVTPVEVAVTESTAPSAEIDSVTPVEVAVTESTASPAEIDSVTSNAISTYRPRGTARGGEYYRLSYREGGRVRHLHIRGGSTDSPISQAKVEEVRSLLAAGVSPAQIALQLSVLAKVLTQ